jgi:hypothetical protein
MHALPRSRFIVPMPYLDLMHCHLFAISLLCVCFNFIHVSSFISVCTESKNFIFVLNACNKSFAFQFSMEFCTHILSSHHFEHLFTLLYPFFSHKYNIMSTIAVVFFIPRPEDNPNVRTESQVSTSSTCQLTAKIQSLMSQSSNFQASVSTTIPSILQGHTHRMLLKDFPQLKGPNPSFRNASDLSLGDP